MTAPNKIKNEKHIYFHFKLQNKTLAPACADHIFKSQFQHLLLYILLNSKSMRKPS